MVLVLVVPPFAVVIETEVLSPAVRVSMVLGRVEKRGGVGVAGGEVVGCLTIILATTSQATRSCITTCQTTRGTSPLDRQQGGHHHLPDNKGTRPLK